MNTQPTNLAANDRGALPQGMPGRVDVRGNPMKYLFEEDTITYLKNQLAELQGKYQKRDAEAKRLADFVIKVKGRPAGVNPELFLVLVAILFGARLAWFALVEEWGTRLAVEGLQVSLGTLLCGAALLTLWVIQEIRVSKWGIAAKAAVLAVGVRVGIDQWMRGRAAEGTSIAVGVVLFCALPLINSALERSARFLISPMLFIRK